MFDLYGYNLVNGAGSASFIKDFSFTTEISPELSTIITIGATANSTVVGENATAFSKFNAGLKDRFKEQIVQSKEERNQERFQQFLELFQNKTALTNQFKGVFKDYVEYLIRLSGGNDGKPKYEPDAAETYRDTLTNIITYQQQLRQVVVDINNKIAAQKGEKTISAFAPGTGFIPFNLSLTMDGLSGMKIYSKFLIDTQVLPANYPDNAEFLIKNIVHKIENNKWFTTLESIVISKGNTDESVYNKKDKNQNSTATSSQPQTSSTPTSPSSSKLYKGKDPLSEADTVSFLVDVLKGLNISNPNPSQIQFMKIWRQHEGGKAAWNPFNTTEILPGALTYNLTDAGAPLVKSYPNRSLGLQATLKTLKNGRYINIINSIKKIKTQSDINQAINSVNSSPWGSKIHPSDYRAWRTFNNLIYKEPLVNRA